MNVEITTIPLGFDQCYVLKSEGVVAIDAGQPKKGAVFAAALNAVGIDPGEVNLIVLTHGHWDHIGSAAEIASLTGAALAIHRTEANALRTSPTPLSPGVTPWGKLFNVLHKVVIPLINVPTANVDLEIDDEGLSLHEFGVSGQVVHTPGHTLGSVSVLLETGEAFVGDLAMNKLPLRLSPGLPIFAIDSSAVVKSWKRLIELGALMIFPAHGPPFPVSVIEKMIS